MTAPAIAAALHRVRTALRRRPSVGEHGDAPALAVWEEGARCVTSHPSGWQFRTDMPSDLGGGATAVTPGWLARAGLAACTATTVAYAAAEEGIELKLLEIEATSRSDTRGFLGVMDATGTPVSAGPHDCRLRVRISAVAVPAFRLRELVQRCLQRSPIACVFSDATPVDLHVDVQE